MPTTKYDPNCANDRANLALDISDALTDAGFVRGPDSRNEKVYVLPAKHDSTVKVFTSIDVRSHAVRARGTDAIRVCATIGSDDAEKGLVKSTRVFRTGDMRDIVERMMIAARHTWKLASNRAWGRKGRPSTVEVVQPVSTDKPAVATSQPAPKVPEAEFWAVEAKQASKAGREAYADICWKQASAAIEAAREAQAYLTNPV